MFRHSLLPIIFLFALFVIALTVSAWTDPTQAPPNCPATDTPCLSPVRIGSASAQTDGTTNPSIWINDTAVSGGNLLELEDGGANRFIVEEDGDVGIGASAPAQRLDVSGRARLRRTTGGAGSIDFIAAVGDGTSRTGDALCDSSLGANDADAICLGHWTSALAATTCGTAQTNSRALCVIAGD